VQSSVPVRSTPGRIEGLRIVDGIDVIGDDRGSFHMWFRRDWLDDSVTGLDIRQLNAATNLRRGTTRGCHVAPWAKYAHPLHGRLFVAIIDARPDSPTYRAVDHAELDPTRGIFIPPGCGHGYQTIDDVVVYAYAVDELWFRSDQETGVSLLAPPFDHLPWPVPDRTAWLLSPKDREAPLFDDVFPA
jgi:dTDP-4-dehydrorhamnose 3,5-epimerase